MSDWFTKEEWDNMNKAGIKALKKQARYKNRFLIYSCVTSTLAILISLGSFIVSIISLVK